MIILHTGYLRIDYDTSSFASCVVGVYSAGVVDAVQIKSKFICHVRRIQPV